MATARPWAFAILGASSTASVVSLAVRIYYVTTQPQNTPRDLAQMAACSGLILITLGLGCDSPPPDDGRRPPAIPSS